MYVLPILACICTFLLFSSMVNKEILEDVIIVSRIVAVAIITDAVINCTEALDTIFWNYWLMRLILSLLSGVLFELSLYEHK